MDALIVAEKLELLRRCIMPLTLSQPPSLRKSPAVA